MRRSGRSRWAESACGLDARADPGFARGVQDPHASGGRKSTRRHLHRQGDLPALSLLATRPDVERRTSHARFLAQQSAHRQPVWSGECSLPVQATNRRRVARAANGVRRSLVRQLQEYARLRARDHARGNKPPCATSRDVRCAPGSQPTRAGCRGHSRRPLLRPTGSSGVPHHPRVPRALDPTRQTLPSDPLRGSSRARARPHHRLRIAIDCNTLNISSDDSLSAPSARSCPRSTLSRT